MLVPVEKQKQAASRCYTQASRVPLKVHLAAIQIR
jgi:hypothetical protein